MLRVRIVIHFQKKKLVSKIRHRLEYVKLVLKSFKTAVINILKNLKENINKMIKRMEHIRIKWKLQRQKMKYLKYKNY